MAKNTKIRPKFFIVEVVVAVEMKLLHLKWGITVTELLFIKRPTTLLKGTELRVCAQSDNAQNCAPFTVKG